MNSSTKLVARTLLGTIVALGALAIDPGAAHAGRHPATLLASSKSPSKHRADAKSKLVVTPAAECEEGYRASGGRCVDIDECAEGTWICGENEVCANRVPGGYACDCAKGYELSPGKICIEVVDHLMLPDSGGDTPAGDGSLDGGCGTDDDEGAGGGDDGAGGGDSESDSRSSEGEGEDDEQTIIVTGTDGLCSAAPAGGVNPSALVTLLAVGAVLVARRRWA